MAASSDVRMWAVRPLLGVVVALAFVAATHDVAIDGYYMEAITDSTEQAAYTGLRVLTYRIAVVFAKSVLVAVAGWLAWAHAFALGGLCMGLLFAFHAWYLPRVEASRAVSVGALRAKLVDFGNAFASYLRQPKIALILLFVMTYKLGDEVLFSMNTPFLMREIHLTKEQLSWVAGIVGTVASIAGSLVSAHAIKRFGFRRAIWPLTLGMNLNIWAYVWLAWALPPVSTISGIAVVALVHAYEQFAAGLGNAVLITYIMRTCKPEFKASHYAMASAVTSIGGTLIGGFGGVIVEAVGYANLFMLAFAASIPSMVALVFLPHRDP
jgi:PAT family beta-lactamase induction signal transducer AmpG